MHYLLENVMNLKKPEPSVVAGGGTVDTAMLLNCSFFFECKYERVMKYLQF
jgi:hypothetical protein